VRDGGCMVEGTVDGVLNVTSLLGSMIVFSSSSGGCTVADVRAL
jgi:hypothetical protein